MSKKLFLSLFILGVVLLPFLTLAQGYGLDHINQGTSLPRSDIPTYVGNVIRWVLGIIGVILVALIVYGGFLYMTSAGNEETAGKAKLVLTYAVIGIVIVAISWIISDYVLSALFTQNTPTPPPT
ncbi:MAG: MMCAP2_0565 family pilin-like conjugal transfer protein [bacterium]